MKMFSRVSRWLCAVLFTFPLLFSCQKEVHDVLTSPNARDSVYTGTNEFAFSRVDFGRLANAPNTVFLSRIGGADTLMALLSFDANGAVTVSASEDPAIPESAEMFILDEGLPLSHGIFFLQASTPVLTITGFPGGGSLVLKNFVASYDEPKEINPTKQQALTTINQGFAKLTTQKYSVIFRDKNGFVPVPR